MGFQCPRLNILLSFDCAYQRREFIKSNKFLKCVIPKSSYQTNPKYSGQKSLFLPLSCFFPFPLTSLSLLSLLIFHILSTDANL
uniref:Uncharacterized protein n=1 Tax=Rhizophora mucronata TaxID=61149 RepID=A0A2P2IHN9_RHIMU